jgi:hypothetical protein
MPAIARCPTCKRRLKRSSEANRRYWALLHAIAERIKPGGHLYSAETWHAYFKSRFLGCDDVPMPNGKTLVIPRSTADLETDIFGDYMTRCEEWANSRGVFLEDMEGAA